MGFIHSIILVAIVFNLGNKLVKVNGILDIRLKKSSFACLDIEQKPKKIQQSYVIPLDRHTIRMFVVVPIHFQMVPLNNNVVIKIGNIPKQTRQLNSSMTIQLGV